MSNEVEWYVASADRVRIGPISEERVKDMIRDRRLTLVSVCWREGFPKWKPVGQVPEFGDLFLKTGPGEGGAAASDEGARGEIGQAFRGLIRALGRWCKAVLLRARVYVTRRRMDGLFGQLGRKVYWRGEALLEDDAYRALADPLRELDGVVQQKRATLLALGKPEEARQPETASPPDPPPAPEQPAAPKTSPPPIASGPAARFGPGDEEEIEMPPEDEPEPGEGEDKE